MPIKITYRSPRTGSSQGFEVTIDLWQK